MPWIHEHTDWPILVWDAARLSDRLAEVRHTQGKLLGRMEALGFDLQLQASLSTLTNDVVKSSAIEGEALSREEVRSSIARRLGMDVAGLVPSSSDVDGIVELMLDATQNYAEPLSAERLHGWHAALFPSGRSGMHPITVGAWRPASAGAMQVVSGPIGKEKVHYEAPAAGRLDEEMAAFLEWFESDAPIDPVIKAGLAHFWFVTIHPFEDGNGRIARAIADLALTRADGSRQRFYSMSAQIEAERKAYYTLLERQQRATPDVTPWLQWFLDCLGRALDGAEKALESVLFKAEFWKRANPLDLNQRQRLVLNRMLDDYQGFMRTSKYARMAKCSPDTALRDLRELLDHGLITQNPGSGRSTSYRLADIGSLSEE